MSAHLMRVQLAQLVRLRQRRVDNAIAEWRQAQKRLQQRELERDACVTQLEQCHLLRRTLRLQRLKLVSAQANDWHVAEHYGVMLDQKIQALLHQRDRLEEAVLEGVQQVHAMATQLSLLRRKLQALELQYERCSADVRRSRTQKEQRKMDALALGGRKHEWVDG